MIEQPSNLSINKFREHFIVWFFPPMYIQSKCMTRITTSFWEVDWLILLYRLGRKACPLFVAAFSRSLRRFLRRFPCWSPSLPLLLRSYSDVGHMPNQIFSGRKVLQVSEEMELKQQLSSISQRLRITTHMKPTPKFSVPTTLHINPFVDRQPNQI